MIYQHRSMTCRRGKLHSRTELFAKTRLDNFESFGSPLIGSFETITGQDAFSIAWQYRQFESFEDWASQQREIAENKQKNATRKPSNLSPYIDEVDTFLLQLNEKCPPIQKDWESFSEIDKNIKGIFIQNIYHFQLSELDEAMAGYFDIIYPSYDHPGADLIGLFGTIVGPGSVNGTSLRQVELIRFEDLMAWTDWRKKQKEDTEFNKISRVRWFSKIERLNSVIMEPTDFS